jgi:radical SAM-linked protein
MSRRTPEGPPPPPVVARVRIRYAKRGRLRFTSHRDFARAFERALRRAQVPMAYSAGFTPHPKISYVGASPTGVASEAEYLEIGLAREVDVERLRSDLDAVLPDGLDVVEAVPAGPGSLPERIEASVWRIELPGVSRAAAAAALAAFLDRAEVGVERLTKNGRRTVDVRGPVVWAAVAETDPEAAAAPEGESTGPARAIMDLVVRQVTPTVRPDDVVTALRDVAGLAPVLPSLAVRLAQGPIDEHGAVGDPLASDRAHASTSP